MSKIIEIIVSPTGETKVETKGFTAVKNKSVNFWKSLSLPYTEPGIRLIRQDKIEMFDGQMRSFQEELDEAVVALNQHYHDLTITTAKVV